MAKIAPPPVHRIAWIQLLVLTLLSLVLLPIDSGLAASAAIGGLVQIIPQAWFTFQAYRYFGAHQARNIVSAVHRGESGKIILTTVLFAIIFKMVSWVEPITLFSSFGVMILVHLLGAARLIGGKPITK